MGLLEKAESGKEPDKKSKKEAVEKTPTKVEAPKQKKAAKPKKESRFSRRREREVVRDLW